MRGPEIGATMNDSTFEVLKRNCEIFCFLGNIGCWESAGSCCHIYLSQPTERAETSLTWANVETIEVLSFEMTRSCQALGFSRAFTHLHRKGTMKRLRFLEYRWPPNPGAGLYKPPNHFHATVAIRSPDAGSCFFDHFETMVARLDGKWVCTWTAAQKHWRVAKQPWAKPIAKPWTLLPSIWRTISCRPWHDQASQRHRHLARANEKFQTQPWGPDFRIQWLLQFVWWVYPISHPLPIAMEPKASFTNSMLIPARHLK